MDHGMMHFLFPALLAWSLLVALAIAVWQMVRLQRYLDRLATALSLAGDAALFHQFKAFALSFQELAQQSDPLFRELAAPKLEGLAQQLRELAQGEIIYEGTETWRTAYEKVLATLDTKVYYSAAWVRSRAYWNDVPGRHSMELNFQLIDRGFRIERMHILPETLWPASNALPDAETLAWLEEQAEHGIIVSLVREADLAAEPALRRDFAIYGNRAAAVQELDDQSRTVRYGLYFGRARLSQELERWERLALYAKDLNSLLDRRAA